MPISLRLAHSELLDGIIARNEKADQVAALNQHILPRYREFRQHLQAAFDEPTTEAMLDAAVSAINGYKDFIDSPSVTVKASAIAYFSPQTKLNSTVMEEFWALLFNEQLRRSAPAVAQNITLYLGPTDAMQNITFSPHSLRNLLAGPSVDDPWFHIRLKDRDFAIAVEATLEFKVNGVEVRVPRRARSDEETTQGDRTRPLSATPTRLAIVSIECKQYLDKTMLDNAMAAAAHLKSTNPFCLELILIELNKLLDLNVGGSGIDNLYLLRKQQLKDAKFRSGEGPIDTVDVRRRNPIALDVVTAIYRRVELHLQATGFFWSDTGEFLRTGRLIGL